MNHNYDSYKTEKSNLVGSMNNEMVDDEEVVIMSHN